MSQFEPVIGLEIHAQISVKTKMFCSCSTDSFGAKPNTNVCPICMGFPGMLPVLNKDALTKGIQAARALHCKIPRFSKFDRKNYFYPDLPKGFQISQYDKPIAVDGYVDLLYGDSKAHHVGEHQPVQYSHRLTKIRINRLHLEDDAGKLTHTDSGTLCDYNRSGCPLMEIVSEPDLRSADEASAYAQEVQRILRYVDASECDMEKGMMRFDINVSLRKKGEEKLGTKAEVKNLNSFRALERALAYEIERQEEVLESGGKIAQETRGWDDAKGETYSQRSKEEAHDYRYFPEPDLPPTVVEAAEVAKLDSALPELPGERKARFVKDFGLTEEDAGILTNEKTMADYFEAVVKAGRDPKKAVSFMNTILLKHLNNDGKSLADCKIKPADLGALIALINAGTISNNMAKTEVFEEMYATGKAPKKIIDEKGLGVVSDTGAIESLCKKIIDENQASVTDFRGGKQNALGFLVGKVMKESGGKANPVMVNEILRKLLA